MIYLASPYSHPDPLIRKTRFLLAQQATASLIAKGIWAYSPIVHCHDLVERFALPYDAVSWQTYNFSFLRLARQMLVLRIDGWRESKGVAAELALAKQAEIPIGWVDENGEAVLEEAK